MNGKAKIINRSKLAENEFKPYYEKENDFRRLSILHSVAAFVISPIFCYFVYNTDVSPIYFYIGISYTILFPVYMLISYLIRSLNDKLIYFFIGHLFVVTYIAFTDLLVHRFAIFDLFCFYALYAVILYVIQRLYPAILYNFFVLSLLIYGYQYVENPDISKGASFGLFSVIAICSVLVLWSRQKMINSVEDFSNYLKKIVNNPGIGYVLFRYIENSPVIIDYNEEALKMLDRTDQDLKTGLFELFNNEEIEQITNLTLGSEFEWGGILKDKPEKRAIKIGISVISLKNGLYCLARIEDISKEIEEKELLEQREQKYRNLYYRNQAGVFTADLNSTILDCNQAFIEMFEGELKQGDKLFGATATKDWQDILDLIDNNENLRNYQTHFKLNNGNIKWFIFNWYIDRGNNLIEGTIIDVSEVQRASSALSQSEEKYRLIYEETNDAILLLDDDKIIDTNRRGIQLFGIPKKELLHKTLWELSYETSDEARKEYDRFVYKVVSSKHSKFNWIFKSNKQKIEAEVAIIELVLGDKSYYQCVIHDQTDYNETMRVLEKNRRSFKSVLDNTPEGIIILCENQILYTNPEIHRLLQADEVEFEHLFISVDQKTFQELYDLHVETKQMYQRQFTIGADGMDRKTVDVTIVSTTFEERDSTMIILKDISLQQRLSKEMMRAEIAEETNKKLALEINERIAAERRLQEQFLRSNAIFDSSSNTLLLTLNTELNISSFNSHCQNYFWYVAEKNMDEGLHFPEFFSGILEQKDLRLFNKLLAKVLKGESKQIEVSFKPKRKVISMEIFLNPIFDTEGIITEISLVAHDITEKKKAEKEIVESLKEKEVLLKEIHHRVKNNLQVISSILNLQSSFVKDKKTLEILEESRNRIRSMAIIHENLYQTTNFSSIDFSSYLQNLCSNLIASYHLYSGAVQLRTDLKNVELVLDQAIPCGLLVNELITNSLKYAFPEGKSGEIFIELFEKENRINLIIGDNGIGLPSDLDILNSDTLGLQLVSTLVEQLEGEIQVDNSEGIKYLITFEKAKL
jgi:PAS domain S-box-containing protein